MDNREYIKNFMLKVLDDVMHVEEKYLSQSKFKNLSVKEFRVIDAIGKSGEFNTMKNIALRLNITQGSLSTAITTLEKKGYLNRVAHIADKRSVNIVLTKLGSEANLYHSYLHNQVIELVYNRLTSENLEGFIKGLSIVEEFFTSDYFEKQMASKLNDIIIMTDSTCDIDKNRAKELGLEILPLSVSFGGDTFIDGVDINKKEFYKLQIDSEYIPQTSQLNPDEFLKIFEECKRENKKLIYIAVSSELSGTFNSASIAREICGYENIYLVNSKSASCGLQALIEIACEMRNQAMSAEYINENIKECIKKQEVFAVLDSLDYIKKGGRYNDNEGSDRICLNSKPVLSFENGGLILAGMVYGRKKAFEFLARKLKCSDVDTSKPIVITYSQNKEVLEDFLCHLKKESIDIKYKISEAGAVIGTHVGPNCLAISYFRK